MKELISWWSHIPEHLNSIFLKIGIIQVHYVYLQEESLLSTQNILDILIYCAYN